MKENLIALGYPSRNAVLLSGEKAGYKSLEKLGALPAKRVLVWTPAYRFCRAAALMESVRPKVADAARRQNRDQTPVLLGADAPLF